MGLAGAQSVNCIWGPGACIHIHVHTTFNSRCSCIMILSNLYLICAMPFVRVINFWLSQRGREVKGDGGASPFPTLYRACVSVLPYVTGSGKRARNSRPKN